METVLEKVRPMDSVQEWWEQRSTTILRVGHEVLSFTAGRRSLKRERIQHERRDVPKSVPGPTYLCQLAVLRPYIFLSGDNDWWAVTSEQVSVLLLTDITMYSLNLLAELSYS